MARFSGGGASAAAPAQDTTQVSQGHSLFVQSCATCHGLDAQGTSLGPEPDRRGRGRGGLPDVDGPHARQGAGRGERPQADGLHAGSRSTTSPPTSPRSAAARRSRRRRRSPPPAPTRRSAQELFSTNCAQCHGFAGAGGALTYGKNAPSLNASTPTQIYEAMLTGPEAMPVFDDGDDHARREEGHHRLHHRHEDGGQPGRLLPGPHRHGHRGPARLARRPRLPRAHRHVAHRQAEGPRQGESEQHS